MDNIAIISDIHGNLEALKQVFKDIEERNIKRIFCLGDIIAKGTNSKECIKLIKEKCEVVLLGNCEDYYTGEFDINKLEEIQKQRVEWNKSKLSLEDNQYLKELPFCHEFYMSGRLIRLFHATPSNIAGFAGNIDKIEKMYEQFLPSDKTITNNKADVVIYGHMHIQFVQRMYNRVLINTGSVGNPIEVFRNKEKDADVRNTTAANYLVLRGIYNSKDINNKFSYELVSIPYDIEKELKTNTDNIELESYREEILNGMYRDMSRIYDSFPTRGIDKDKI